MSTFKIYPLRVGTIHRKKANMFSNCDPTEMFDFPLIVYYLENEQHKILVDTGGDQPESSKFGPYTRTKDEELDQALKNIGVDPKDIDIVIFTHLHWDHSSNNHLFPNARFICQRREYEYLAAPEPSFKLGYEAEIALKTNYELVDGDCEIVDGVSVVLTPGHSIGMQCVVVDTTAGKYILAGDLITVLESWRANPKCPNPSHEDTDAIYKSVAKIEKISDLLLPGHDPEVFSRKVYP